MFSPISSKRRRQPESLYSGVSRADEARGRAAQKAAKDQTNQAARKATPDRAEEGLYSGKSRADEARANAAEKAGKDEAKQAARRATPDRAEEGLYSGKSRADEARQRAEQRAADNEQARELGLRASDIRADRAWRADLGKVKQEAATSALQDAAGLVAVPAGAMTAAAIIARRVAAAAAGFQARTPRPIITSRFGAQAAANLSAAWSRLESALNGLAA